MKRDIRLILIFSAVASVIFSGLYFYQFNEGFSENQDDWGSFGSYISAIAGISMSLSVFIYTIYVDRKHEKVEIENKKYTLLNLCRDTLLDIDKRDSLSVLVATATMTDKGDSGFSSKCDELDRLKIKIKSSYVIILQCAGSLNIKIKGIGNGEQIKKEDIDNIVSNIISCGKE